MFRWDVYRYIVILAFFKIQNTRAQITVNEASPKLVWCTTSDEEQWKCGNFSAVVVRDRILFSTNFMQLSCKKATNKEACMTLLDEEMADITSLDAGDVFMGGRYHSLIPIMQEMYAEGDPLHYSVVAVIKKNSLSNVKNLHDLRGTKACFPGVGSLGGWVIPIEVVRVGNTFYEFVPYTLMKDGGLQIIDCNNHVKSAINYFGPSCAVNSLINKYNPIGDNSDKLCQLCVGDIPGGRCTPSDPYYGFEGAFRCLVDAGEIAFLKHTTVLEMTSKRTSVPAMFASLTPDDFELVCRDGSRRSVRDYADCSWGKAPTDAIMVSSAKPFFARRVIQEFLLTAVRLYGRENATIAPDPNYQRNYGWRGENPAFRHIDDFYNAKSNASFRLFESPPRAKKRNLLVQDASYNMQPLDENRQTFHGYLGDAVHSVYSVRHCPVPKMTLCVTSDAELEKCIKMQTALASQLLKPEMSCYKGRSHVHCMQAINSRIADVAVFDAGDIYMAGLHYDQIPFMSEVYNLGATEYYSVAVAKEEDPSTELTYLRGKYTCHAGVFTGASWIVPMAYLISNGWIRSYACDSLHAASEYFSKSCVPGAMSPEYASTSRHDNLCHLCHGAAQRYCRRDASEDYYGYTGAMQCLVEGGGNVAFLKHTTIYENTDGKRRDFWARNTLNEDFQLLCPDGTRSTLKDYEKCNLGKVKANAIVTRGGGYYNHEEVQSYINLFVYAQQLYGRKEDEDFSMFTSSGRHADLIFQDATQQLQIVEPERRNYKVYLGKDFMRARRIVDCHASASKSAQFFTFHRLMMCLAVFYILSG